MRLWLAGGVLLLGGWFAQGEEAVSRIAFGSCYKPQTHSVLWTRVEDLNPQVWLWLGDNVYVDFLDGRYIKTNLPDKAFSLGYENLAKSEGVSTLKKLLHCQVMATWDDHDYGLNDAGKAWARKGDARRAFVKFFGGPDRPDGVYSSREFGPSGKRVRVILLDTRFNRDDPGPHGDVLGTAQWKWLEGELKRPGADLVVIGSSIQVLAREHRFEKWGNFPQAKARLFDLIRTAGTRGVIFVSGDRHNGEISCQKDTSVGYPLYDVTSSGLTEVSSLKEETNSFRLGGLLNAQNFGVILVDWSLADPFVSLELRDAEGSAREKISFPLSQLAPPAP